MKLVRANYRFEEVQTLVVRLFDIDSTLHARQSAINLASQDFIGEMTCQFAQVMSARGSTLRGPIINVQQHHRSKGSITIVGEEVANCNAALTIQLSGENLDNKVRQGSSSNTCRPPESYPPSGV